MVSLGDDTVKNVGVFSASGSTLDSHIFHVKVDLARSQQSAARSLATASLAWVSTAPLRCSDSLSVPGLYAAGDVAGGAHWVVFCRVAGASMLACWFLGTESGTFSFALKVERATACWKIRGARLDGVEVPPERQLSGGGFFEWLRSQPPQPPNLVHVCSGCTTESIR